MRTGRPEVLHALRARHPTVLSPGPIGPLLPDEAMVLPLAAVVGEPRPIGALVLGVNPYRPLDDEYRAFLTLIGAQVGVALADSQAFEAQRQRVRVLADLDLVKMAFFQNVSHEFRTPLTLLLAPLQDLLEPPGALRDEQREHVEVAVRAAQRLRRIVDALLDFAQAEAGTLAPERQPVDLARATVDTASMFRSTTEHAGLRLEIVVPTEPAMAKVDAGMWSTIVTNLVANAVKFTDAGGVTVRLAVTADEAVLTVADTGVGISVDEQARVFDRFYQAPRVGTPGGAGIGLALVSDLVRAHDGAIELASTEGQGSTFAVTIPRVVPEEIGPAEINTAEISPAEVDPDDGDANGRQSPAGSNATRLVAHAVAEQRSAAQGSTTDPTARAPAGAPARPRVLLAEDDADLRTYLARILIEDGWEVTSVADAETASAALSGRSADAATDLVLTDVMLPGPTGPELVTDLRANESTSRLPIVVLTARGGPKAAAEGLAAGADDYLTKPFVTAELLARARANYELNRLRERAIDVADNRAAQLRGALDSNRIIGTATGILMATHRLSAAQGFQLLARASQDSNRKLRDLAVQVVESGRLPFRQTAVDNLIIRVTTPRR
jgi:signal transduction histidine kinase/DNA-binding response OmpR family regulator